MNFIASACFIIIKFPYSLIEECLNGFQLQLSRQISSKVFVFLFIYALLYSG